MRWILIILALLYILSPYDLLPDFIPLRGWIDDFIVLVLMVRYLSRMVRSRRLYRETAGEGAEKFAGTNRAAEDRVQDPYKVLGVPANASAEQIRHAYRKLVNQYHPDKVAHLGEEFQALAEKRFKEIQQAYQRVKKS